MRKIPTLVALVRNDEDIFAHSEINCQICDTQNTFTMKKIFLILFLMLPTLAFAELVPAQHKNGKWGYKAYYYAEKFVIAPKFEAAHRFAGDYAFVCQKGLWGIIGKDGKFAIKPKYSSASEPYDKTTIIGLNGKFGLAKDITELTAICYDHIKYSTKGNYFFAQSNGKYGLLDGQSGKALCEIKYDDIQKYEHETFLIKSNGKCGLLDKQGKLITAELYDDIQKYEYDTFLIKSNGKYGLLDKQGKLITAELYDDIQKYEYDTFLIKSNGKYGLLDKQGKLITAELYDNIQKYKHNTFLVKLNGKCGLLDKQGKLITAELYDDIQKYEHETFLVKSNDKYGLLDKQGKQILPVQYDNIAKGLYGQTFMVNIDGVYGICDLKGEQIVPMQYDSIEAGPANTFLATAHGCTTLLSAQGKFVTDQNYKHVVDVKNGVLALLVDDGWQFLNMEGKQVPMPDNVILYTTTDGEKIELYEWDYYWSGRWYRTRTPDTSFKSLIYAGCGIWIADNDIREIKERTFRELSTLKSILLPNNVTEIGSSAFSGCSNLTSITIPNSVTSIEDYAFYNCTNLTSITIPGSITKIEGTVFKGCNNLKSVDVHISDLAKYCTSNMMSYVPGSKHLYINGEEVVDLVIPNGTTKIGQNAFIDCSSLTGVTIPDSVASIGCSAFENCWYLNSITIPDSVTKIDKKAFKNCYSLASVTIGKGVTYIGSGAFSGCDGLTKVDISDLSAWCKIDFDDSKATPLSIAHNLYLNGNEVNDISISSDITTLNKYVFYGCETLANITIPDSVTLIKDYAFYDCSNLKNIAIGKGIKSIKYEVFSNCSNLQSIYLNVMLPPELNCCIPYGCKIYVPHRAVNVFKSVWSDYRHNIYGYDFGEQKVESGEFSLHSLFFTGKIIRVVKGS